MQDGSGLTKGIKEQIQETGGFPRTPIQQDSGVNNQTIAPGSAYNSMIAEMNRMSSKTTTTPGTAIPIMPGQVDVTGRYPKQVLGADMEELYAQGQTPWSKFGHGFLKMLGNTAATFITGTVGLVDGVGEAINQKDISKLWSNDVTRGMNDWTQNFENKLPNYYTHKETSASALSPTNIFSSNFWFDKVMKNLGFSLGAAAGGMAWGAALRAIGLTGMIASAGADMNKVADGMDAVLSRVPQAERGEAALSYLSDASKKYGSGVFERFKQADRVITAGLGTWGESSMEAIQNYTQYKQQAIQDYKDTHGYDPTDKDMAAIEENAKHVGNWSMALNIPLLTATNYIMFPKILNMSYGGEKAIINDLETQPLKLIEGKIASALPQKGVGRLLYSSRNIAGLFFNPTEAFEEGAQNVIQEGTIDYFNKAKEGKDTSFWQSLGVGVDRTLNTKNGVEQILIGGLSGALQTSGIFPAHKIPGMNRVFGGESQIQERGWTGYGGERAAATQIVAETLNKTKIADYIKDSVDSFNRAQVLQEERAGAIRQGDIFASKEKEYDYMHNYLTPRIKYGKFDFVKNDIEYYKQMASNPEQFDRLKREGITSPNDTQQTFLNRLDNFERNAQSVKDLYESINIQYAGLRNKEGQQVYTPDVVDKMVYAASKINDYDKRIPQLSSELVKSGISVQDAIDNIYLQGHPSESATKDALNQINNLSTTKEKKDNLKRDLQDVLEMALRRGKFIKEYDRMGAKPEEYRDVNLKPEQVEKESISYKEGDILIGQEYNLKNPVVREGNTLTPNPKITVLSQTLGGEFQVRMPNGQTSFLTKDQIEKYQLTTAPREEQKVNEILNKAVDKVLKSAKYKDVVVPAGQTPLEYVNSLDNKDLTDDILDAANKDFGEMIKTREKQEKELKALQEAKTLKEKLDKSLKNPGINTGNIEDVNAVIRKDKESDASRRKPYNIVFPSTTSASEAQYPDATVNPRIVRERNFLYNQSTFPDNVRNNLKALVFTVNSEASLGLDGFTQTVYDNDPLKNTYKIDDKEKAPVLAAYVIDRNGKYFFVDQNGKPIIEVGKGKVDTDRIIVSTLPDNSPNWRNGSSRFREQDQDKVADLTKWWTDERTKFFNSKQFIPKEFTVSRGLPVYDEYEEDGQSKYRENSPVGTLFPKQKAEIVFATQGAITVADTDAIRHQGIEYATQPGRIYFTLNDRFAPLSNRKFTKSEQDSLYKIIHQLAKEKGQAERLRNYLKNVLYFPETAGKNIGLNQIWVDKDWNLNLGKSGQKIAFTPTGIEENEATLKTFLAGVYNNTNNQTLKNQFSQPFEEITDITPDGKYVAEQWKNYQEFLLTKMLTTPIREISEQSPRNFQQKYAILQNVEYKAEAPKEEAKVVAQQKTAVPTGKEQQYTTTQGENLFYTRNTDGTITLSKKGDYQKAIDRISELKIVQTQIEAGLEKEEAAKTFLETALESKIPKETPKVEEKPRIVEEKPKALTAPQDDEPEFREISYIPVDRMGDIEKREFTKFIKDKLPQFTVEEIDHLLTITGTRRAWGKLQGSVISLYKAAEKGTGYHEAFHAVYKYFLTPAQQEAINEEVRNRPGTFVDRVTQGTLNYSDASDQQIVEKLADEFADFKTGKKTSVSKKIGDFFRRIINFFRTFLRGYKENKPLVDELFNRIEKGAFKDYVLPDYLDRSQEFSAVPKLTVAQTHGYVQDIQARVMFELLREGQDLFDLDLYKRNDIFNTVKSQYQGVIAEMPDGEATFNALVEKTKESLATYRISFDENSMVTINDENHTKISYDSSSEKMKMDVKKSQPFALRLLLGTLYKTKANVDENGNVIGAPTPDKAGSAVKGYQLLTPSRTTITLLEALSGATSIDDMVDKLSKLVNQDSDYARLLNRLGKKNEGEGIDFNNLSQGQWRMLTALYDSFNKQKPYVKGIIYRDGEVYFRPMDVGSTQAQVFNGWENSIRRNARSGQGVFKGYDKNLRSFNIDQDKFNQYKKNAKGSVDGQLKFLNDLGINIDRNVYNKLSGDDKDRLYNEGVAKIFQYLDDKGGLKTIKARVIGISGPLTVISSIYAKATRPDAESTFINGDGEQQQTYVQPNYVSHFENVFNSVQTLDELKKAMPQLNDVYTTNSEVLKPGGIFFDAEGNRTDAKLRIGYLNASESNTRNKVLKDTDYPERLDTQLNSILSGTYYISVPADGSTEWTITFPSFIDYKELLAPQSTTKINDKMYAYLQDEIALAKDERGYLDNVGNKEKELRFFKDILSSRNVERINRVIADEITLDSIDRESLNEDFQNYIDGEIKKLGSTLVENESLFRTENDRWGMTSLLDSYVEDNISKSSSQKVELTGDQVNNILRQMIVNDFVANTELHKILFGDPYNFKTEKALDETKRIKSFLSPAQPSLVSEYYNNKFAKEWAYTGTITDYSPRNIIRSSTIKDVIISSSLPGYDKVNEADSQALHTIQLERDIQNRHFKWDKKGERWMQWQLAYTRVKLADKGVNIGDYTPEQRAVDTKIISNPEPEYKVSVKKPIVRGPKAGSDIIDNVLDKFSSAPIWYKAVEGTNLENLYVKMLKEGRDYVILESGRKLGAEGVHSLYNDDGSFNTLPFNNKVDVGWENYAIQVENNYDESGRQTRGTQITKLFSLDFFEDGKPNDYEGTQEEWNSLSSAEKELASEMEFRKNENNDLLNALTVDGYDRVLDKLGLIEKEGAYEITDRKKLYKTLRDEAFKRDMPDNLRDVFRLDEKGEPIIPFEASSEYTKIQKMLYSIADRNILSPTHNGGQKTQMSVLGWESKNSKRTFKGSETLNFYSKENPYTEILLPNWFRKKMDPKDQRTDEELLKALNSSAEGKKILEGIGFRIPTQAANQIEAFRVKGFLDAAYGDTVVVPSEITTKAGSDFDIDKLNTYLRNIYINNKGEIKSVPYFGIGEEAKTKLKDWLNKDVGEDFLLNVEEPTEEPFEGVNFIKEEEKAKRNFDNLYTQSLENAYIDNLLWFTTHPDNFERLTQPTEGGPLKSIANDIADMVNEKEDTKLTNLLSVNSLSKTRQQFMSAKKWIGIIVNGITSHAQAQRTQLYLDVQSTPLSKKDEEILGDGAILLPHNTTVINGRTLPTLSRLKDKAGKYISDKLSWYATAMVDVAKDPYISKIIHNRKLVATFSFLERIGVPTRTVALFMNQPIIREYLKFSDREGFSKLANPYWRDQFLALKYFPNTKGEAELETDEFEDCIRGFYHSSKPFGERLTEQQNRYQNLVLNEFLKYFKMAENLFNFSQATNWDTADLKTGGAIAKKALKTKREDALNIFKTPVKILSSTGLSTIAKTMVNVRKAVSTLSRFETGEVRSQLDGVLRPYASLQAFQTAEDFEKIDGQITNSFIDYLIQTNTKLNAAIPKLIIDESTSAAAKVDAIKKDGNMLNAFNNNPIFNSLQVRTAENGESNLVLKPLPKSAFDSDMVTGSLRELKELSSDLYGSIVRLALLQGVGRFNNLLRYIPSEDFAKALEPIIQKNMANDAVNYKENHNFERNNWKDNSIVPEASKLKIYFSEKYGIWREMLHSPLKGVIKLTDTYNADLIEYPLIKVKNSIPMIGYAGRYDLVNQKAISNARISEMATKGDYSFMDMVGYQKVTNEDGTPFTTADKKGNTIYYYKQVNLMGDANTSEHYTDGRPSVLDNNTVKVDTPADDKDIIARLQGPVKPIPSKSVPTQPPSIPIKTLSTPVSKTTPKKVIPVDKELQEDLKKASREYLKDWLADNPRYYIPIPKEEWNKEDLDEYYKRKGVRITIDNLKEAQEQNKVLGDQIMDKSDPDKSSISSIIDPMNDYLELPMNKDISSEFGGFGKIVEELNKETDPEIIQALEEIMKKYGLGRYTKLKPDEYNPNQLTIFPEEGTEGICQ